MRDLEILKELSVLNKVTHFNTVEKHFRKMVRKIFLLSFEKEMMQGGANTNVKG